MVDEVRLATVVGARVRELRLARKWSQRHLADAMGVAQSRISELENGAVWTTEQIEAAAAAFDVAVVSLLPGGPSLDFAAALTDDVRRVVELCQRRRFVDAAEVVLALRHKA